MPFCANCGSPVEGRFCAKCGTPLEAGGAAPPPPPPPPPQQQQYQQYQQPPAASAGMGTNVASALCYLVGLITGIVFLVLAPYNQDKTVRFHAFQSIFFNVAAIAVGIGFMIFSVIVHTISFWLGSLVSLVHLVVNLGFFVLWLYLMWKAYNNERVVLPIIGPLAEKQA